MRHLIIAIPMLFAFLQTAHADVCRAAFYAQPNLQGPGFLMTSDVYFVGNQWNDRFLSFEVIQGHVMMFIDKGYKGGSYGAGVGRYYSMPNGFALQVSSMRCFP